METVAIHHIGGHARCRLPTRELRIMALIRKSEYLTGLSADARARHESKISSLGLTKDPYCIEGWTEAPEDVPSVQWSDVMIYMVSTPSPYTREEIKVSE